jgi:hypothetical protein
MNTFRDFNVYFPRFGGYRGESARRWCHLVDEIFATGWWNEQEKLIIATFHLDGPAAQWYYMQRDTPDCCKVWQDLRERLIIIFDDAVTAPSPLHSAYYSNPDVSALALPGLQAPSLSKYGTFMNKANVSHQSAGWPRPKQHPNGKETNQPAKGGKTKHRTHTGKCYNCRNRGHVASECPLPNVRRNTNTTDHSTTSTLANHTTHHSKMMPPPGFENVQQSQATVSKSSLLSDASMSNGANLPAYHFF